LRPDETEHRGAGGGGAVVAGADLLAMGETDVSQRDGGTVERDHHVWLGERFGDEALVTGTYQ
jgi:hypothetical protein